MKKAVSAVAGEHTSQGSALTHNPILRDVSVADGHVGDAVKDPRVGRGGRHLSAGAKPLDAAVVPHGLLRELAQAQIRRACRRRWDFNWDAFVADRPEWGITEIVHRRVVQQMRGLGLGLGRDVRPTDIPTDTVLSVVRDVIGEWTESRDLRPTEADFCEEQGRRGEKGRETQQALAEPRNERILALVEAGVSDAEISRQVGLHRSQVGRIRKAAKPCSQALQGVEEKPAFPAPEILPAERWPVTRFNRWTGIVLAADDAYWLADMGRCYEAEGRVQELMNQIQMSAGARDPWAYLQKCVSNRGDTWSVKSQLLADVLVWAGEKSLMYSLTAIGGGYIQRPLPYLREVLAKAVREGVGRSGSWERPVAMSVGMARQWAPELVIVDADEAIAGEAVEERMGHVDSFRRCFGRLPWEAETAPENAVDLDVGDADVCCIGLKGLRSDDSNYQNLEYRNLESSPGSVKANATPALCAELDLNRTVGSSTSPDALLGPSQWEWEKIEQPLKTGVLPDSDEILRPESDGGARKLVQTAIDPLVGEKVPVVLEHGRCRHPLASLMASAMVLFDVVLVDCAAGCGHQIYSGRGPLECPCHWPPAKAAWVARALQVP